VDQPCCWRYQFYKSLRYLYLWFLIWGDNVCVTTYHELRVTTIDEKYILSFLKYLRIFFAAFQYFMPGLTWYLLVTLKAYETSGRVHNMAYMIEPIAEAYGTLLIKSCRFYCYKSTEFYFILIWFFITKLWLKKYSEV
jgi:hypothetical protein